MNERIERLRSESVGTVPSVSGARARLLTSFYQSLDPEAHSAPLQRALAFRHLLEHQPIHIGEYEVFFGEEEAPQEALKTIFVPTAAQQTAAAKLMFRETDDGFRVPLGITLYDAGIGHYKSSRCGPRTQARAIGAYAYKRGTYQIRFFGGKTTRTLKVR